MVVKELSHKGIIDLNNGVYHYIARTNDNKIYCWCKNMSGLEINGIQYEDQNFNKPKLNSLLSNLNIISIKCGAFHSMALTQRGEVYAWGQIGCGSKDEWQVIPIKVNGLNG
jgi:alpha-tubulin suppressor-like RCC1 family protein